MAKDHDSPITTHHSPLTTPPINAQAFIDITKPPFNAVGDGVTYDTKAFQDAVNACTNGMLRFPPDESARSTNDCPNEDGVSARDELKSD